MVADALPPRSGLHWVDAVGVRDARVGVGSEAHERVLDVVGLCTSSVLT